MKFNENEKVVTLSFDITIGTRRNMSAYMIMLGKWVRLNLVMGTGREIKFASQTRRSQ